jgi:hypothetical protein
VKTTSAIEAARLMETLPLSVLELQGTRRHFRPTISGSSLLKLVASAESPHVQAERVERLNDGETLDDLDGLFPGAYSPACLLTSESYLGGVSSDHGMDLDEHDSRRCKTQIFGCDCGINECWLLLASIRCSEDRVLWFNFEQLHRDWQLDLGPFLFDLHDYRHKFEVLPDL